MNSDQAPASHLPAPLPSPAALLHRTQATLGLLRDVVQESSAEYWYERGKAAMTREEWEDAASAFKTCIMRDSDHWRATLQLAVVLAQQDNIAAAEVLSQAYSLPYLKWKIWKAELVSEDWQMLRTYFESQENTSPNNESILFSLSLIYLVIRGPEFLDMKALEIMKNLHLSSLTSSPAFYRLMGAIERSVQMNVYFDFEESEKAFEKSAAISKSASDFYSLGTAREDDYWPFYYAIDDYMRAIKINKNHIYANFKMGDFYYKIRESYVEALPYFEHVTKIAPDFAVAFLALGICQEHIGDNEAAVASCKLAFEIDPSLMNDEVRYDYYASHNLKTNALIAVYDRIIERNSKNAANYRKRGLLKFKLEDIAGGVEDLRKSRELSGSVRE